MRDKLIKWTLMLCLTCSAFTFTSASASAANDDDQEIAGSVSGWEEFRGNLRLPKFAVPTRYDIRLKPDLIGFTFNGTVKINVNVVSGTAFLVLNAATLNINIDSIGFHVGNDKALKPIRTGLFKDDQILVLEFKDFLPLGVGILSIEFQGTLNDEQKGFYRSTYGPGIPGNNIAVTKFEAIYARRMFPCWDEPAFKATFKITLDVPSELLALSNMPIAEEIVNGNIKTVVHHESPIMSTYLVAVVVGSFDFIEGFTSDGIRVRVYCPVGKSNEGKFALNVTSRTLDIYKDFFTVPYALPKLDLIGIPDFDGGMENYGLITFSPDVLYINQDSEIKNMMDVVEFVTHELGHQWTGNLVTMDWWTHIWLNEGFASWLAPYATDHLFPEWRAWTQFRAQSCVAALTIDGLPTSHPIEVPIKKTDDINGIFDRTTYQKGSCILQMLHSYLGPEKFQRSIASYIQEYSWSNSNTEEFWNVLTRVSGMPVSRVMRTWKKQQGYPVISIKASNSTLELKQAQFLYTGSRGRRLWIVPITLCCGTYDTCHSFLLSTKSQTIDMKEMEGCACSQEGACPWIKVNINQTGFYKVKYEEGLVSRLRSAIKKHALTVSDRFGVLYDLLAYHPPLASLLNLVDSYTEEDNSAILSNMISASNMVVRIASDATPRLTNCIKKFFIEVFEKYAQKLDWDTKQTDSSFDTETRVGMIHALALLRHNATLKEATRRFQAYLADRNTSLLPTNIREVTYVAVMQSVTLHNQADYLSLLALCNETNDPAEKSRILGSLITCPDPGIVTLSLNYLLTTGVPLGYSDPKAVSWEGREAAWTWLKDNWDLFISKDLGEYIDFAISIVVPQFASNEAASEVKDFFSNRTLPSSFASSLNEAIDTIYTNARWVKNIQKEKNLAEVVRELSHGNC